MGSLYKALIAKLSNLNKILDISIEFAMLTSDQDRIRFGLNLMWEYDIVPEIPEILKNSVEAEKFRIEGNGIYVSPEINGLQCLEALECYTKSIAHAVYDSTELALAYANRAAVLFKIRKYAECISDIDRALQLPYPDNLRWKLYIRKLESAIALGNSKVEEAIKEAENCVDKMSPGDVLRIKLKAKLDIIKATKAKKIHKNKVHGHRKTYSLKKNSENSEVPCASDAIIVKYNATYGRHVVAARKIHPGEVIALEKPFSLILKSDSIYTHCSYCLQVSWANIPCKICTYAMYCSEECRTSGLRIHHDIECFTVPVLIKLQHTDQDLLGLRFVIEAINEHKDIQNLRKELEDVDNNNDPRTKGFSSDGKLHSDKYRSVYSLETNTKKRSVSDLFMRAIDTCCILYVSATCTTMFGSMFTNASELAKNNDVTFIGGLILRHQQIIPTNIHSIGEERGLEHVHYGLAALPFFSLLNHSCDPNTSRLSTSEHEILIALYPIEKDEQLYDNYGQHYAATKKDVRKKMLLKQYYFDCECVPCKQDWPLFYQLESYKDLVTHYAIKDTVRKALTKFSRYVTLAEQDNIEDQESVIKDLLQMIQVLYDYVPLPCEEMNFVLETLKRVYSLCGNRFDIPKI